MKNTSIERKHIAFFGVRNAGKSSLVNAVTGQMVSVVSEVRGTTTDPVYKAMELLPVGPVMIIDTPGIDDAGALGDLRAARARETLRRTDLAILVVSAEVGLQDADRDLIRLFRERKIPCLIAWNKADLAPIDPKGAGDEAVSAEIQPYGSVRVSARTGQGIPELKKKMAELLDQKEGGLLVEDLAGAGDVVVLVTPIDESAPKGRLILPQQMVIRALLDQGAIPVVTKETTYEETLRSLTRPPRIVITDSQVFSLINEKTPREIALTSFSILMARFKGVLEETLRAAAVLDTIRDGDGILIAEGCTHHRQCNDIGTVKLPDMIRRHTGAEPVFSFASGRSFPDDLSAFRLIIHCGACMLNEQEMKSRTAEAGTAGIPMTNYGIVLAKMSGILARSTEPVTIR